MRIFPIVLGPILESLVDILSLLTKLELRAMLLHPSMLYVKCQNHIKMNSRTYSYIYITNNIQIEPLRIQISLLNPAELSALVAPERSIVNHGRLKNVYSTGGFIKHHEWTLPSHQEPGRSWLQCWESLKVFLRGC